MAQDVNNRYARAMADLLSEPEVQASAIHSLAEIAEIVAEPEIGRFFAAPGIPAESKLKVLDDIFEAIKPIPEIRNLLRILVIKKRITWVSEVADSLRHLFNTSRDTVEAIIRTARPLSKVAQEQILRSVEAQMRRKIKATFEEDPSLVGGFVAEAGHVVLDGSLKGFLDGLGQRLMD